MRALVHAGPMAAHRTGVVMDALRARARPGPHLRRAAAVWALLAASVGAVCVGAAWFGDADGDRVPDLTRLCAIGLVVLAVGAIAAWQLTQTAAQAIGQATGQSLPAHLAQEMAELRQLAETDPLTGLTNRRGLARAAGALWSGQRGPLGALIFDVDYFKRVNDQHGHRGGDVALRCVGETIRQAIRQDDCLARFGGEEFVVLVPDATHDALLALGERVRASVAATRFTVGAAELSLTVSVGAALRTGRDADAQAVIDRADQALYCAKAAGRNQVALRR